jgi:hypothetical protein
MTVITDKSAAAGRGQRPGRLFDVDGERSLDDVITTAWGGLALRGSTRCPVCGATATRDREGEGVTASGLCTSCCSTLE